MSDNWNDEGQFFGTDEQSGSQNPIRALREKAESDSKTIKELKEELAKLRTVTRQTAVADLLKSKGLDPVVAELVPADVEATPDALEAWYGKYSKVFNPAKATSENETEGEAQGAGEAEAAGSTVPESEQDALGQMVQAMNQNVAPAAAADLQRKMENAGDLSELLSVIKGQQGASTSGW